MRVILVLIGLLAAFSPAHASGGMVCTIDDASVKFRADSAFSGGPGPILMNFGATLEIRLEKAPAAFRSLQFGNGGVRQVWVDRDELKLEFIHEPVNEPPGPVRLTIETQAVDEGAYRGRYTLSIFGVASESANSDTLEAHGEAECFAE